MIGSLHRPMHMLSPIVAAINLYYRMTNIQCQEMYANFMYVYNDYKTTLLLFVTYVSYYKVVP